MPQQDALHRIRHHKCRRCGLRVKTEERPVNPWDEADLLAQVKALLPEGKPVYLREQGITELSQEALNARLARQGYLIDASQSWNAKWGVACIDGAGRVTRYALFELRQMSLIGTSGTDGEAD